MLIRLLSLLLSNRLLKISSPILLVMNIHYIIVNFIQYLGAFHPDPATGSTYIENSSLINESISLLINQFVNCTSPLYNQSIYAEVLLYPLYREVYLGSILSIGSIWILLSYYLFLRHIVRDNYVYFMNILSIDRNKVFTILFVNTFLVLALLSVLSVTPYMYLDILGG